MKNGQQPAAGAGARPPTIGPSGHVARTFPKALEAEFIRGRLRSQLTLIRVSCALGALLAGLRWIDQVLSGYVGWPETLAPIIAASVVLLIAICTSHWERTYPPVATVLVPVRNVFVSLGTAAAAAAGQPELLMVLPLAIVGPFFFLGLGHRAACLAAIATIVAFVSASVSFGLAAPIVVRVTVFMVAAMLGCLVAARQLDQWARRSFVEGHMIVELAEQDSLTGLKNRRVFDERLEVLWRRAIDEDQTLAVLLFDVDRFKAYNDCYGHQAGDGALADVARTLESFIKGPADVLARYGGEEFAVIVYGTSADRAVALADRMRAAVGALRREHRSSPSGVVTISAGVALVEPTPERRPQGAVQLADEALYQAKLNGRNRVELLDPDAHGLMITGVFSNAAFRQVDV